MKHFIYPKSLFILIILLGSIFSVQAQSWQLAFNFAYNNCDSSISYHHDGKAWYPISYQTFKLNSAKNPLAMISYDSSQNLSSKLEFVRNSSGITTQTNIHVKLSGSVVIYAKYLYTYNSKNQVIYSEAQTLDLASLPTLKYVSTEFDTLTYDSKDNLTTVIHWKYNSTNKKVQLNNKYEYTYNSSNEKISETSYDLNGSSSTTLRPYRRETYTLTNGRVTTSITETSNSTTNTPNWAYSDKTTSNYNATGYSTNSMFYNYDSKTSTYVQDNADTSYFDASGNYIGKIEYVYKSGKWNYKEASFCEGFTPGKTTGTGSSAPAAPSKLTVVKTKKKDDAKMLLTWQDNSNNETGFIIWRSLDDVNFTAIDSVVTDIITYTDATLAYETKYFYKVSAYNGVGASATSTSVSATTFTSLDGFENYSELKLFPNPCNGKELYFSSTSDEISAYQIFSTEGKFIQYGKFTSSNISLNNLIPGAYIIRFSDSAGNFCIRKFFVN